MREMARCLPGLLHFLFLPLDVVTSGGAEAPSLQQSLVRSAVPLSPVEHNTHEECVLTWPEPLRRHVLDVGCS